MIKEYGYEYDTVLYKELWDKTKGDVTKECFNGAYCLRSGRDALKAIAREFEPCVALIPALACDSMIHPFELYGHEIQYYRLNDNYSIDIAHLPIEKKHVLFLYMDYFGHPAICDNELNRLRANGNITFIEDRTHNLIWDRINIHFFIIIIH